MGRDPYCKHMLSSAFVGGAVTVEPGARRAVTLPQALDITGGFMSFCSSKMAVGQNPEP